MFLQGLRHELQCVKPVAHRAADPTSILAVIRGEQCAQGRWHARPRACSTKVSQNIPFTVTSYHGQEPGSPWVWGTGTIWLAAVPTFQKQPLPEQETPLGQNPELVWGMIHTSQTHVRSILCSLTMGEIPFQGEPSHFPLGFKTRISWIKILEAKCVF